MVPLGEIAGLTHNPLSVVMRLISGNALVAAEGSGGCDPEEFECAGEDQIAGEGHDQLGGQRDAGGLDRHEQDDARVAGCGDYRVDEDEDEGQEFFGHFRSVYRKFAVARSLGLRAGILSAFTTEGTEAGGSAARPIGAWRGQKELSCVKV